MKPPLAAGIVLAAAFVMASVANAGGVNLSWDACSPEGGVQNKNFACTSNAGSRTMYGSFVLAADQNNFVGTEITLDISAQSDSLPAWWRFFNAGACRQTSLSVNFLFASDPNTDCTDPWSGQGVGGIGAVHTYWTTPQVAAGNRKEEQMVIAAAVPRTSSLQLTADTEYYCFKLVISSTKTVGSEACDGCTTPVCITLSKINAVQNDGTNEELTEPVTANLVTWQGAESCPGAFAGRAITWGQIRSVLR